MMSDRLNPVWAAFSRDDGRFTYVYFWFYGFRDRRA